MRQTLRKSILAACKFRKHDMARERIGILFKDADRITWTCRRCGAWAQANSKPAPNEIDAGGPALAVNCTGR